MPCYNAEEFVTEAINSVINQSYPNIELIIVDDGSSDNSYAICQSFVNETKIKISAFKQENSGPYPARNNALGHANGAYVAFLDADDYWDLDCLTLLYQTIAEQQVDVAYCGWQNFGHDGGGSTEPYIPPKYEDGHIVKAFLKSCPWPIHAALIKREVIQQLDNFSERYFTALDFDLWLRMTAVTQKMALTPKVLAYYRWHNSGQISAIKSRQVIDAWKVRRDYVANHPEMLTDIPKDEISELVNGNILVNAYRAYWRRDIDTAVTLFRKALMNNYWGLKDLKYILLSLLPKKLLENLLQFSNRA
ncbi:MAG: glycosyltransferase [Methyloprofundus sp.]|nr:glycosyltransferase [Methyloprofundus sp.]